MSAGDKSNYSQAKKGEFVPEWTPPKMQFPNKVSISDYEVEEIRVLNTLEMYLIEQKTYVSGVFGENFELEDFPFDCQDLQLKIYYEQS